jgi:flagellin-specific chaperone FliS
VCRLREELREGFAKMGNILDALEVRVTNIETVGDSMEALMQGLAQELKDAVAANDPVRIQAVIDSMDTKAAAWAAAVVANTPPPVPPPAV